MSMLSLKRSTGKYCNLPRPSRTLSLSLSCSLASIALKGDSCFCVTCVFVMTTKIKVELIGDVRCRMIQKGELLFLISKQWFFFDDGQSVIQLIMFSRFCHLLSDIDSDSLNNAIKHYLIQRHSITKYYKVLQSIT